MKNRKIGVFLSGSSGRMGTLIAKEIAQSENHILLDNLPRLPEEEGRLQDFSQKLQENLHSILQNTLKNVSLEIQPILIDFTQHQATAQYANIAAALQIPFFTGTTGISPADKAKIAKKSTEIALCIAPNTSLSAHIVAKLAFEMAQSWQKCDLEVIEMHHKLKKDAPSGTALWFSQKLQQGRQSSVESAQNLHLSYNQSRNQLRENDEIGISVVRGGDVVGEHAIFALGMGEQIRISHIITDRAVFARGALHMASNLATKTAGIYEPNDLL